jgi:nitrite reductase (NADH) large subunit
MAPQSRRSWWWIIGLEAAKAVRDWAWIHVVEFAPVWCLDNWIKAPVYAIKIEVNIGIHLNKATQYIDGAESITEWCSPKKNY